MSDVMCGWQGPLGNVTLVSDGAALVGVYFEGHQPAPRLGDATRVAGHPVLDEARRQLDAFVTGQRTTFTVPVLARGTAFQRRVWQCIAAIPFGQTTTYGAIAAQLQSKDGSRAVGAAAGRNPLCIVVPCHRVVAADGGVVGYAGGVARKRWLLTLESPHTLSPQLDWLT